MRHKIDETERAERRRTVWACMCQGVNVTDTAILTGCSAATIVSDRRYLLKKGALMEEPWPEGSRIALTQEGWGKMPAGTLGTVLKEFTNSPIYAYAVEWDTGVRDCIEEDQARLLAPLEQLASVV